MKIVVNKENVWKINCFHLRGASYTQRYWNHIDKSSRSRLIEKTFSVCSRKIMWNLIRIMSSWKKHITLFDVCEDFSCNSIRRHTISSSLSKSKWQNTQCKLWDYYLLMTNVIRVLLNTLSDIYPPKPDPPWPPAPPPAPAPAPILKPAPLSAPSPAPLPAFPAKADAYMV